VVSLATRPPAAEQTAGLIWRREMFANETASGERQRWYADYRVLSIVLLAITALVVIAYW
jgi:SSS family solute:Na+ symporter